MSQSISPVSSDWDQLKSRIISCDSCILSQSRTQTVIGSGNQNATVLFVGEGPGAQEDQAGLPFVGRSGQLLTEFIEGIGLKRDDVYITNVVKCRPNNNRNPELGEIIACMGHLVSQVKLINPKVIVTLGAIPSKTILQTEELISRLRGKSYDIKGMKVIPTFHPAYILRNKSKRPLVEEDFDLVRQILNT